MANRPVYVASLDSLGVRIVPTEFKWFSGYSVSQKQKSIADLHLNARQKGIDKILEVSSKSPEEIGVCLSAFNLKSKTLGGDREFSVESAFQGSKVFEQGGPYKDLIFSDSRAAKKDQRIKNSGPLKAFRFFHYFFELEPKTFFYDWLYVNTLLKNKELIEGVKDYRAFTDIEFNPKKSLNCQAFSLALFRSLLAANCIDSDKIEPDQFKVLTTEIYDQVVAFREFYTQLSL
ncbi:DUF6977 family protein [Maridesulfovibrio sp.]|uniref:DarT1-associated NADAR antitoxin family protein n=1 Tax=Maridesulfovibrio sp. TaxID=2795000 RepID=UPI0029C9D9C9|nr:hypothetical protein [Maridesulfovibrio sp.]